MNSDTHQIVPDDVMQHVCEMCFKYFSSVLTRGSQVRQVAKSGGGWQLFENYPGAPIHFHTPKDFNNPFQGSLTLTHKHNSTCMKAATDTFERRGSDIHLTHKKIC